MTTAHIAQAQRLATDALVELYEIDTTALTNVQGTPNAGIVYTFTPGTLPQRYNGQIVNASAGTIVLDRPVPIVVAEGYAITVTPRGGVPVSSAITGTSTDLNGNLVVSVATLSAAPSISTSWSITGPGIVSFGGVTYTPFPITVSGYEKSGQGKLARPKLTLDNTILFPGTGIPMAAAMVIEFADALGAKITRLRVFAGNLDFQPGADSSAVFEPDIFYIDRKASHTKQSIEFELTSDFDQVGLRLPARQIIRDICTHTYRRWNPTTGSFIYGSCPYNDPVYFKYDDTGTGTPAQDVCGKRFQSCKGRFGVRPLPARFFPGVGLTRA